MADNQQRYIYGAPSFYSEIAAHDVSDVAIRSTEQDLFAKFTAQAAFDLIDKISPTPAGHTPAPIVHLGDLLDYSCWAEYRALTAMPWLHSERLTVAPGNHDGLFQGNGTYGGKLGWLALYARKLVHWSTDPSLEGHHDSVCQLDLPPKQVGEPCGQNGEVKNQMPAELVPGAVTEMKDRRAGWTRDCRRDHVDAKEQPHHIRCDLLQLSYPDSMPAEARGYCDDMTIRRYFAGAATSSVHTEIPTRESDPYARSARFEGGKSAEEWDSGYLLQRIEVALIGNDGKPNDRVVWVVLLDSQGWKRRPSAKAILGEDATVGSIGAKQQAAVLQWLRATTAASNGRKVEAIVFAGHYPLEEMAEDSVQWLASLQRESPLVLPLYLSAHTHSGYLARSQLVDPRNPIWEINVGSLIDFDAHFRDLQFVELGGGSGWAVRSHAFVMREELKCEDGNSQRSSNYGGANRHATSFLVKAREMAWHVVDPRPQWCLRLSTAAETMSLVGRPVGELDPAKCARGAPEARVNDFVARLAQAERDLLAEVLDERAGAIRSGAPASLGPALACAALGGALPFKYRDTPPKNVALEWRRREGHWEIVE